MIKDKDYYTLGNFDCIRRQGPHEYTKTVERVSDYDGRKTYRITCTCGSSVRALQYASRVPKRRRR